MWSTRSASAFRCDTRGASVPHRGQNLFAHFTSSENGSRSGPAATTPYGGFAPSAAAQGSPASPQRHATTACEIPIRHALARSATGKSTIRYFPIISTSVCKSKSAGLNSMSWPPASAPEPATLTLFGLGDSSWPATAGGGGAGGCLSLELTRSMKPTDDAAANGTGVETPANGMNSVLRASGCRVRHTWLANSDPRSG